MRAITRVATLMPVLPSIRVIGFAIQRVVATQPVVRIDATISNALSDKCGRSFDSVIITLSSAGPTSNGNASGVTATPCSSLSASMRSSSVWIRSP